MEDVDKKSNDATSSSFEYSSDAMRLFSNSI